MTAEPLFVDSKGREIAIPAVGRFVADTHAHLDMLDDPALALARAARAGVRFIATVADVTEDGWRTYDQLDSWRTNAAELLVEGGIEDVDVPRVRVIVGAHPHNAKDYDQAAEDELRRLASDPVTCALGELGLDYHYDHSPRDVQRDRFRRHLGLAHEFGLPVVIHLREAHDDGLAILTEVGVPDAGAILHCYTLGPDPMRPFLDLGCHVSFAGPVTFKKAEEIREAASLVPTDRILTETDCPFMAPEPFRGRTNEPALVVFTAAKIAHARGEQAESFARRAFESALALLDGAPQ
ncbi:MAG TPA: TatD family hydrolase [Coriobacteriia bacterium]|nr:TatD family hydrolase [Coriobacteriia bacterium]